MARRQIHARGGAPRDLTPGAFDSPTFFLGAPDGYAISPDGTEVCFTSNRTGHPAWTTNNDLYLVSTSGGAARNITEDNPGSDASPQYSPNGRYIAYTSQARDGYESDLFRLRVYDRETHQIKDLTAGFDQWIASFAWAPDSDTLYFVAPERYDDKAAPKLLTAAGAERLERLIARLAEVDFTPAALEAAYRDLAAALGVKLVDLAQLTRLAVTGGTASPPLFEVLALLGRDDTLARLRRARWVVP